MPRLNGGIIGPVNNPSKTLASGMWPLTAAYLAKRGGTWPLVSATIISTFTSSGTWTAPSGVTEVEYLVVAGGGGGGGDGGGGGGAGGFRTGTGFSVTAGTDYTITVGAGGTGTTTADPMAGSNSVFSIDQFGHDIS